MHTVADAAHFRRELLSAIDDAVAETQRLHGSSEVDAMSTVDRALTSYLRRSSPDERCTVASLPDVLAPIPPNVLPFARR